VICVGYSKRAPEMKFQKVVPLKEQNDRIRAYAEENGWKVSKFYEDKGDDPSGDAGFQKMRIDGMNRRFDLVILDSVYRCGKNPMFARELLLRTFYLIGIHFVILEDGINSMAATREELERYFEEVKLFAGGLRGNKKKYGDLIQNNQIDPMKERYGYVLSEDKTEMLVDKEAAEVIRLIFDMTEKGINQRQIAKTLNENGVEAPAVHLYRVGTKKPKPNSCEWSDGAVSKILHNKFLAGGEDVQLAGKVYYPPIIERERLDRIVGSLRKGRTGMTPGRKMANCLNGRITYNGTDEKLHVGLLEDGGEKRLGFYRKGHKEPVAWVEDVLSETMREIGKEKKISQRAADLIRSGKGKALETEVESLHRQRARELYEKAIKAQEGNIELYQRHENGEISGEEFETQHEKIMQRQREVNDQFHFLVVEARKGKHALSIKNPWIVRYGGCDPNTPLDRKKVMELIEEITIFEDRKLKIRLNTCGKEAFPEWWLKEE